MMKNDLTSAQLKRLLSYQRETGIFRWRVTRTSARKGDVAGHLDNYGYRIIGINGRRLKAHRLAWFYVYGQWPRSGVDHINRIPDDNRICNLREATTKQNGGNRGPTSRNKTGFRGVSFYKRKNKFQATAIVGGKLSHLGYFSTAAEADRAARKARVVEYGEFSGEQES